VLERYLIREAPSALISADNYANLTALDARRRARAPVPVIVTQRTHTSTYAKGKAALLRRLRETYPQADAVVGVSMEIVEDLVLLGVPRELTRTIHNPVIGEDFDEIAARPVDHPWFQPGEPPVILGVGRIGPQKDFPCLIRAFARVRQHRPELRLVILGEAKTPASREELVALARDLEIADAVDLPGAVPQAIPYMARAGLFALSSRWEGLPGALIEALACGTPVVSTDCPSGPDEVLESGRYGGLAPVGDAAALAAVMVENLDLPPDRASRIARGRRFSVVRALADYAALVDTLSRGGSA
jgi:glycosyltransferase involved in cell wall biosynthesis